MHIGDYALESMCDVFEISKRTYYKYRAADDTDYYDYLIICGSKKYLTSLKGSMDIVGFVKVY